MPGADAPLLHDMPLSEIPWDRETVDALVVIVARTLAQKHHEAEEAARGSDTARGTKACSG